MDIEIIADEGESWKCLNITTRGILHLKKSDIDKAIRLGKAEIVGGRNQD